MSEIIKIEDFFSASDHKLIIRDVFAMYHHKWDVIGECVQNAVDSVLKRGEEALEEYKPFINITYNPRVRELIVEDNGFGISDTDIERIAAPHVSFKNPLGANRGEFGVGLTLVAFSTNDFRIETVCGDTKSILEIKNGYSWAMDENGKEELQILLNQDDVTDTEPYTKVFLKPVRFPEYALSQLEYVLRRYTAIGDFWNCYNKKEDGFMGINLTYYR
jgi:hypothetical protein